MNKNSSSSFRASFAVVGHPNKGKSSIVSTLARNDSIEISRQSGTTKNANQYRIDTGKGGFELIDTPGFQRPRQVLKWLKTKAKSADQYAGAIKAFVLDEACKKKFPDEVELLTPLVDGAAILYVVDGSRPYGNEYETEMEILRWTGRPSMALINPIESNEYVVPWQNALNQFFKLVQIFNPMNADLQEQVSLLKSFALLEPKWKNNLNLVIEDLLEQENNLTRQSINILADLLVECCSYQFQQKVLTKQQAESTQEFLKTQYNKYLIKKEKHAHHTLLELFSYHKILIDKEELKVAPDLFDTEQWYLWGLNKNQLMVISTMTGIATGALADMALAGSSFLAGAVGGGILGFTSAVFGSDYIGKMKLKGLPLGGYLAQQGPIKDLNFPYVLIGRFLFLYQQLKNKNHADRKNVELDALELSKRINRLKKEDAKQLHKACSLLVKQKVAIALKPALEALIVSL
ncbi:MAG: GTPase SAR1 family protein [Polaribacter sp.]|jgi:GTPase SAR1 family protein/uncharacterized membrane protein